MAFFEDLNKTLTSMGKEAAQKTRDAVDVLQLKGQISSEKSKLRDLYALIGKNYYEQFAHAARTEYASACEQIQGSIVRIADMEAKIRKMENTVLCPSCSMVMNKSAAYCSKCGKAMPAAEEEPTAEEPVKDVPAPLISEHVGAVESQPVYDSGIFVEELDKEE